ncbi:37281_t:CDS:2, partial [Gigaspora margarita]
PLKWRRNNLFGVFQSEVGHIEITSNHSSLEERAANCQPGYFQCPGYDLCCSKSCGEVCNGTTCCEPNHFCCGNGLGCCPSGDTCCGAHCCESNYFCCGNAGCCPSDSTCCGTSCCDSNSFCCGNGTICCLLGYQCCGNSCCGKNQVCGSNGFCENAMIPPTTISNETFEKIALYLVNYLEDNNYDENEANQLEEKAEKLVNCVKNFGISLVKLDVEKNDSCISCDQINTLSNFNTNSTASKDESVAILKLLYSLDEAIVDANKCKFIVKCMNINGTCANSQSSGCTSNSISNFLMTIGIILCITIMNLNLLYDNIQS